MHMKNRKGRWKRVLLTIFAVLLVLLLLVAAGGGIYMNYLLDRITPYDTANDETVSSSEAENILIQDPDLIPLDPESTEEIPELEDVTFPTEEPEPEIDNENVINILLIGQDRNEGEGRQRSDSMILLTYNKKKQTVTLTSFMRDAYVQIPGYRPNKLNSTYAYGGMKLLNETLKLNYGVEIDGNVEVDFSGFKDVVDRLGGVDISLTQAEVKYMNHATDWNLQVGMNRLNGEQALVYSRIREIDNDYRRAERQRTVILSLIERYKSLPVTEMLSVLEDILPMVTTNMDKGQIVGYALELGPKLATAEYSTMRIPVDGTFNGGIAKVREGLSGWFQYNIDFEANRKVLLEIFASE